MIQADALSCTSYAGEKENGGIHGKPDGKRERILINKRREGLKEKLDKLSEEFEKEKFDELKELSEKFKEVVEIEEVGESSVEVE